MEKGDDPYRILGLSKSDVALEPSCIKKNFRQLARIHHPDKNRVEERETAARAFAKINHAYEVLREEETRRSYDLSQLHSKQQGYDPNGPTYFDENCNKNNHANVDDENNKAPKNKQTKKTSTTTSTSRRTTYPVAPRSQQQTSDNNAFGYRTASTTTTDKVSGKPQTLSFKTTSDGITKVEVESFDGTRSSYSVPRLDEEKHKEVYELFRDHFGTKKANTFFSKEVVGGNGVNVGPEKKQKPVKSKSDLTRKKATDKRKTKKLHPPSSPRQVSADFFTNLPSTSNTSTGSTLKTTNNNTTKPKKQKQMKAVQVPDTTKKIISTSKTSNTIDRINTNLIDKNDDNIQSMSMKERVVLNPKTKRKEVVVEITLTKFDGSIETRIERRHM